MSSNFAQMPFAQFADQIRPSGASNRLTLPGTEVDAITYSVYMNGPLAAELPVEAQEYHFKDVMVAAVTEKMGLDAESFRDNMKIAEIVATRSTWMAAVLEATKDRSIRLSPQVMHDYELLASTETAMEHPWIQEQIERQVMRSMGLAPVLVEASKALGHQVRDRAPRVVSEGRIVSQNDSFTVQSTGQGEVVTHENDKLTSLPQVGSHTTVSYYRGHGQVVESLDKMKVSDPFIEGTSNDIAVVVVDGNGKEQMVLFNSISAFHDFVDVHGLEVSAVEKAMFARDAAPKPIAPTPTRTLDSAPFIDPKSGCIAINFTENGITHSAVFADSNALALRAKEYGVSPMMMNDATRLEGSRNASKAAVDRSLAALEGQLGTSPRLIPQDGLAYSGKVVAESEMHVAVNMGRNGLAVFDLRNLDRVVRQGETMTVAFEKGRGKVAEVGRDGRGVER